MDVFVAMPWSCIAALIASATVVVFLTRSGSNVHESLLCSYIVDAWLMCIAGLSPAVGKICRERKGRDVYVVGAANVGKSAFVRAMLKVGETASAYTVRFSSMFLCKPHAHCQCCTQPCSLG